MAHNNNKNLIRFWRLSLFGFNFRGFNKIIYISLIKAFLRAYDLRFRIYGYLITGDVPRKREHRRLTLTSARIGALKNAKDLYGALYL